MNAEILIGTIDSDVYIKASGNVTANLSFPLREHLLKKISSMQVRFSTYIDLSGVEYMDSTFMGLLVGIEREVSRKFKDHLFIINPSENAMKCLKSMRLNNFLTIQEKEISSGATFSAFDENVQMDEMEKSKIVLNAHKNLSSVSKENQEEFQMLQDMLENEISENENRKIAKNDL
jgi:anti-anti-sigma factor